MKWNKLKWIKTNGNKLKKIGINWNEMNWYGTSHRLKILRLFKSEDGAKHI